MENRIVPSGRIITRADETPEEAARLDAEWAEAVAAQRELVSRCACLKHHAANNYRFEGKEGHQFAEFACDWGDDRCPMILPKPQADAVADADAVTEMRQALGIDELDFLSAYFKVTGRKFGE